MSDQTTRNDAPALPALPAGALDFDFFHGRWRGRNRRLMERLAGCQEWTEFDSTVECWPMLGGLANVDEYKSEHLPGFVAMTVRVFDPKAQQWAIYWADNRYGTLDPPMRGAFEGDLGIFFGADFHQGRAVLCRFLWRRGTPTNPGPRWEQAFSADGGQTWETNWTMDFTRL
jgi:hypothetical protein